MDKHRKILATLLFALGSFILLAVSAMLIYNFLLGYLGNVLWNLAFIPFAMALVFFAYVLLKSKKQLYPYIIGVAVINMIIVPIGTLIAIYCLWFHYKYVKTKIYQAS